MYIPRARWFFSRQQEQQPALSLSLSHSRLFIYFTFFPHSLPFCPQVHHRSRRHSYVFIRVRVYVLYRRSPLLQPLRSLIVFSRKNSPVIITLFIHTSIHIYIYTHYCHHVYLCVCVCVCVCREYDDDDCFSLVKIPRPVSPLGRAQEPRRRCMYYCSC